MAISYTKARALLDAKKQELESLRTLTEDDRGPVELDQQSVGRLSRMDAMQVQAMAKAQERQRLVDLQRIDAALRRMADDEYGYCSDCGEEIAEKRLEVDPMATRCISCASLSEA